MFIDWVIANLVAKTNGKTIKKSIIDKSTQKLATSIVNHNDTIDYIIVILFLIFFFYYMSIYLSPVFLSDTFSCISKVILQTLSISNNEINGVRPWVLVINDLDQQSLKLKYFCGSLARRFLRDKEEFEVLNSLLSDEAYTLDSIKKKRQDFRKFGRQTKSDNSVENVFVLVC